MRYKEITIPDDDEKYVIGALTLEQIETFFPSNKPIEEKTDEQKITEATPRTQAIVCVALNNGALRGQVVKAGIVGPWDVVHLKATFDIFSFDFIRTAIFQLSGLITTAPENEKLGESAAITK